MPVPAVPYDEKWIAVSVPSFFAPMRRRATLLGRLPTLSCSSRRSSITRTGALRLLRQARREHAEVARAELGAEAAAHELGDDADLALRDAEHLGQLVAHRGGALRGRVDGEPVVAPVGHDAVRLHRAVRLHLRAVRRVDHHVGLGEAALDVADGRPARAALVGPAHVARLRHAGGSAAAPGAPLRVGGPGEDERRVWLARLLHVDDERQRLVLDAHEARRLVGRGLRDRRDRGDGLPHVAHDGVLRGRLLALVAKLGAAEKVVHEDHGAHAGRSLGGARVDGADARVRQRGAHDARPEHARAGARRSCSGRRR